MADIIIENPKKSKKWLWAILIIFIIIIVLGVFYYFWKIADKTPESLIDNSEFVISGQLPKELPEGLPIEARAILQSKEMKYEGGTLWEVSYLSDRSLVELRTDFSSYLSKNDWITVNEDQSIDSYFVYASKEIESLNINLAQNQGLGEKIVVVIAFTKVQ